MNKQELVARLLNSLVNLGFTYAEAQRLRRIEKTLNRWAVDQCNGDIQRDEETGKPYRYYGRGTSGPFLTTLVPDRETGALKQLARIVADRNERDHREATANRLQYRDPNGKTESSPVVSYHQGDPRGCSLYIIPAKELKQDGKILPVSQYYNRGIAICA
jgi:hypothetical protein